MPLIGKVGKANVPSQLSSHNVLVVDDRGYSDKSAWHEVF